MAAYWDRYSRTRSSRRRFLGGVGATGAGAAGLALVGCGDDSSSGGGASILATPTSGTGATPTPADPFAGAKRGGTYSIVANSDPPTIDPMGNTSFQTRSFTAGVYSRLFRYKCGPGLGAGDVAPEGDLVQSYETTPDGLKWTLKLKNAKFHNVAPVNGRQVNTDDIKYSWGRMTDAKNANKGNVAFVDKIEYPDASTVVMTLKAPNVGLREIFTDTTNLIIMPAEADGKFDPTKTMIGSGPWLFDSYVPSQGAKYKRNPDWFDKGPQNFPLMDGVDFAILPEYAAQMAQFRAGSLDSFAPQATDLIDLKKAIPGMTLYGFVAPQQNMFFFDNDPTSPWKDARVRQAISMSISRDQITELLGNVSQLRAGGIDVKSPWNNLVPAGLTRWWLDPQSADQGASAKFFKYDVAGAKALLAAAGFPDGFEATLQYPAAVYGKTFSDSAEAHNAFLNAIGIKTKIDVQDYSSKYITQTFAGNFKGIVYGLETGFVDVGGYPNRWFTDNPLNHGHVNDPDLIKLTAQQQGELDVAKRKSILADIQRKNAEQMYYVPSQWGAVTGWTVHQPWLMNGTTYVNNGYGGGTETLPYRWKNKA